MLTQIQNADTCSVCHSPGFLSNSSPAAEGASVEHQIWLYSCSTSWSGKCVYVHISTVDHWLVSAWGLVILTI